MLKLNFKYIWKVFKIIFAGSSYFDLVVVICFVETGSKGTYLDTDKIKVDKLSAGKTSL